MCLGDIIECKMDVYLNHHSYAKPANAPLKKRSKGAKGCVAYNCRNYFKKESDLSFHRFPKDPDRRCRWIAAVDRKNWLPSNHSWLCGKHFQKGKPSTDSMHPDYVPSIFSKPIPRFALPNATKYEERKARRDKRDARRQLFPNQDDPTPATITNLDCNVTGCFDMQLN